MFVQMNIIIYLELYVIINVNKINDPYTTL